MLALICIISSVRSKATTEIIQRSPYRIVVAADSRALYGQNRSATECKLFEVGNVYATVSGFAHYGRSYYVSDAIREGFAGNGTFASHVSSTALFLQRRVERQLAELQARNMGEYRSLISPASNSSDFIQLAVAQTVRGQLMLGIVELRRAGAGNRFTASTTICPGACSQKSGIFFFGYWDRIKPYVASSGQPRSVGSAASLDQLIRLEIGRSPGRSLRAHQHSRAYRIGCPLAPEWRQLLAAGGRLVAELNRRNFLPAVLEFPKRDSREKVCFD
jgi:hypothetical protein